MTNLEKITMLYKLGSTKDEILSYVITNKITKDDYKTITGDDCPTLSLDDEKNIKSEQIKLQCQETQLGGFHSTAYQGVDKVYASDLVSQQLITGNATAAASQKAGVESCKDDKFMYKAIDEESYNEYTADEIATLGRDLKVFIEQTLIRLGTILKLIESATSIDDLDKITWDMTLS